MPNTLQVLPLTMQAWVMSIPWLTSSEDFTTFLTRDLQCYSSALCGGIQQAGCPGTLCRYCKGNGRKGGRAKQGKSCRQSHRCNQETCIRCRIPSGIKELGAKEEDLELLAEHAMQDVCRLTNPRNLSKEEIIEIYRKAL